LVNYLLSLQLFLAILFLLPLLFLFLLEFLPAYLLIPLKLLPAGLTISIESESAGVVQLTQLQNLFTAFKHGLFLFFFKHLLAVFLKFDLGAHLLHVYHLFLAPEQQSAGGERRRDFLALDELFPVLFAFHNGSKYYVCVASSVISICICVFL
jgi:hypothetical protein